MTNFRPSGEKATRLKARHVLVKPGLRVRVATSQSRPLPSWIVAKVFPSGEKTICVVVAGSELVESNRPEPRSYQHNFPSSVVLTSVLLSGDTANALTTPDSVVERINRPDGSSHQQSLRSRAPLTRVLPSSESAKAVTLSLWPPDRAMISPAAKDAKRTIPFE